MVPIKHRGLLRVARLNGGLRPWRGIWRGVTVSLSSGDSRGVQRV